MITTSAGSDLSEWARGVEDIRAEVFDLDIAAIEEQARDGERIRIIAAVVALQPQYDHHDIVSRVAVIAIVTGDGS